MSRCAFQTFFILRHHFHEGDIKKHFFLGLKGTPSCFRDGSSEVTDFLIFSGARQCHSSPRWKVVAVSPQSEGTHSQSLHDDDDGEDDDDDSDDDDDDDGDARSDYDERPKLGSKKAATLPSQTRNDREESKE